MLTSQTHGKNTLNTTISYDTVAWTALKKIESGILNIDVVKPDGTKVSNTKITFNDGFPISSTTNHFNSLGIILKQVNIDYSNVKFNQDNQPFDSSLVTNVQDPQGRIMHKIETEIDDNAKPVLRKITSYTSSGEVHSTTNIDFTNASFNSRRKVVSGTVSSLTQNHKVNTVKAIFKTYDGSKNPVHKEVRLFSAVGDDNESVRTNQFKRKDGSLYKTIITQFNRSKVPVSGIIIEYDLDGITVVKRNELDFTGTKFDNNRIASGAIISRSFTAGKILKSSSTIKYS